MSSASELDLHYMALALEQAEQAGELGEVPIGAVLVQNETVIASAGNRSILWNDPSAHAEMNVLRKAGRILKNYRLPQTTLYVSLEPCPMCLSAMIHARVERVVFGASDPKTGALGGVMDLSTLPHFLHKIEVKGGVLEKACTEILVQFFKARRRQKKSQKKILKIGDEGDA